jgi:superfamily II DNA or RNA helicase
MVDIKVLHKSEAELEVYADKGILREINKYFSFKDPDYRMKIARNPKMQYWYDGRIYLGTLNKDKTLYKLPFGLVNKLSIFAKESTYSIDIPNTLYKHKNNFKEDYIDELIKSYNLPFEPYDYQRNAFKEFVARNKVTIVSPVSSGKTLIAWLCIKWLYDNVKGKILYIVPNKGLLKQAEKDFKSYGCEYDLHLIQSGIQKDDTAKIYISTWQSIFKEPKKYFQKFDAVILDEAHGLKISNGGSLKNVSKKLSKAVYRIAMTGTTDPENFNIEFLIGMMGPLYKTITTKELQDQGKVSKIKIQAIKLSFPDSISEQVNRLDYFKQQEFLESEQNPLQHYIIELANALSGVTLILFRSINHGAYLYDMLLQSSVKEKVIYIDGTVNGEDRIKHVNETESHSEDVIVVASYGVFSTGISLKRIKNLILASGTKSQIRLLQSCGRVLRKHAEKEKSGALLIDLVPVLKYSEKHFNERVNIYKKEKFNYKIKHVDLKEWAENRNINKNKKAAQHEESI